MKLDIKRVKIFVTIPVEDVDKIRGAVCDAGAGVIGEYDYCTTSVKSVGTLDQATKHTLILAAVKS